MKWHKLTPDCKPDEGKHVLVSFACAAGRYLDACRIAILYKDNKGRTVWTDDTQCYRLDSTDRWAYIELPED